MKVKCIYIYIYGSQVSSKTFDTYKNMIKKQHTAPFGHNKTKTFETPHSTASK